MFCAASGPGARLFFFLIPAGRDDFHGVPRFPLVTYFLAAGVTVSVTRWPSRRTTTGTGWPILTASMA